MTCSDLYFLVLDVVGARDLNFFLKIVYGVIVHNSQKKVPEELELAEENSRNATQVGEPDPDLPVLQSFL